MGEVTPMCTALLMAGGRSERMRSMAGGDHKALVPVLGIPMIERNLRVLLDQGFKDIVVAVNVKEMAIIHYLSGPGKALTQAAGAFLRSYEEVTPLGTIGAAGAIQCHSEPLLVVNVDNLSTLDLRALVFRHKKAGAALTIATHVEAFTIPFGQLVVEHGYVCEYREKPDLPVQLSSGTYVLSTAARRCIPPGQRTDIPDLFELLRRRGEAVAAYPHSAIWIDVNDPIDVRQAEQLIRDSPESFELCNRTAGSDLRKIAGSDAVYPAVSRRPGEPA
jgi:mannose-1-phosphate guanylyltransferase